MIISNFTQIEIDYLLQKCNFTALERELLIRNNAYIKNWKENYFYTEQKVYLWMLYLKNYQYQEIGQVN